LNDLYNIVEGCKRDERRCQKDLYDRYYAYTLKIVFRYIHQYDKAVDVVNDGFVKVFRNFSKFYCADGNVEMMLMGWMKRIMINTAIDQLRKDSSQVEMQVLPDNIWDEKDNGSADNGLMYKELVGYIKKLPPGYRMVFNLFVIDGFSHQEISSALGITVGTSKSNLAKARVYLQNLLKKDVTVNVSYATQ
jgi:RNA polymerase sigma factor (sigma-70 family)